MRTALVTGGNRGIGREVCGRLSERGYHVYLGSRDVEAGRRAASAIQSEGTVECVCPGWVRTDMGGSGAPRDVSEGADTIVWLATRSADSQRINGRFLRDRKVIDW